jgi:hypothetical protein
MSTAFRLSTVKSAVLTSDEITSILLAHGSGADNAVLTVGIDIGQNS